MQITVERIVNKANENLKEWRLGSAKLHDAEESFALIGLQSRLRVSRTFDTRATDRDFIVAELDHPRDLYLHDVEMHLFDEKFNLIGRRSMRPSTERPGRRHFCYFTDISPDHTIHVRLAITTPN